VKITIKCPCGAEFNGESRLTGVLGDAAGAWRSKHPCSVRREPGEWRTSIPVSDGLADAVRRLEPNPTGRGVGCEDTTT
jgi:hypothetical protein